MESRDFYRGAVAACEVLYHDCQIILPGDEWHVTQDHIGEIVTAYRADLLAALAAQPAPSPDWALVEEPLRAQLQAERERAEKAEQESATDQWRLKALQESIDECAKRVQGLVTERDALAANCTRLREALEKCGRDLHCKPDCVCEKRHHIRSALAETPSASLAKLKAEVLRGAAAELKPTGPSPLGALFGAGWAQAAKTLEIMADALDPKEATDE